MLSVVLRGTASYHRCGKEEAYPGNLLETPIKLPDIFDR